MNVLARAVLAPAHHASALEQRARVGETGGNRDRSRDALHRRRCVARRRRRVAELAVIVLAPAMDRAARDARAREAAAPDREIDDALGERDRYRLLRRVHVAFRSRRTEHLADLAPARDLAVLVDDARRRAGGARDDDVLELGDELRPRDVALRDREATRRGV